MRSFVIIGAIACLSACATVTVKPASITTSLITEDSQLTKSAKTYKNQIVKAGFVEKTSAFSFLQSKLFDSPDNEASKTETYAEKLFGEKRSPEKIVSVVLNDIRSARIGLLGLNTDARSVLSDGDEISRKDVVAFEDALVTARQAKQSFAEALDGIMKKSPLIAGDVSTALKAFDAEIDVSRQLADEITKTWQGTSANLS